MKHIHVTELSTAGAGFRKNQLLEDSGTLYIVDTTCKTPYEGTDVVHHASVRIANSYEKTVTEYVHDGKVIGNDDMPCIYRKVDGGRWTWQELVSCGKVQKQTKTRGARPFPVARFA